MSAYYETITVPADQIQLVFGQFDRNIKNLEKAYQYHRLGGQRETGSFSNRTVSCSGR